jgi:hypothetical protein
MTTQHEATTGDDQRWLHEHMAEMPEYNGKWVAVLGRKVVASGNEAIDVVEQLENEKINGALLVQFPDDVTRKVYLIA